MSVLGLVGGGCDAIGGLFQLEQCVDVALAALDDGLALVFDDEERLRAELFDFDEGGELLAEAYAVGFPAFGHALGFVEGVDMVFLAEGLCFGVDFFHFVVEVDGEAFFFFYLGFLDDFGDVDIGCGAEGGEDEDDEDAFHHGEAFGEE